MLIPQLKVSIIILTLFLAGSIAAKAIGSLQPINPAMRGFIEGCEDKPQPCWYGVVPGETKLDEGKQSLQEYGLDLISESATELIYAELLSSCSVRLGFQEPVKNYSHIITVSFSQCPRLRAGDIMLIPGTKELLENGIAFFDGSAFGYALVSPNRPGWISSPLTLFTEFTLMPLYTLSREFRYKWHSFMPLRRYCQLEPQFPDCWA